MRPILKNRTGIPPFDILEKILATNKGTQTGKTIPATTTAPYITWVADSDARVQPSFILSSPEQKIFTVRNLANQITTSQPAIDYGVLVLHTPVLLITGNTDNQSIRFFVEGYTELNPTIRQELNHLYPSLAMSSTEEIRDNKKLFIKLTEDNVDYQVALAIERYRERIEKDRLVVVGSILDTANQYGEGQNRLFLININGEKEREKLKKLTILRSIAPELLNNVGRPKME